MAVPEIVRGDAEVGRWPTMLISPLRTLKNCGSSSRLVFLKILPTRVMRGSSGILKSGGGRTLRCAKDAFSSSAFRTELVSGCVEISPARSRPA